MQSIVMPEYGRIGQATRPYPPNISRLVCGDLLGLGRGRARCRSGSEGATTVWLGSRRRLRTAAGGCATGQHRVVPRVSTEVAEHAHSARRKKRSSLSCHFSGKRRVCRPAVDTFFASARRRQWTGRCLNPTTISSAVPYQWTIETSMLFDCR